MKTYHKFMVLFLLLAMLVSLANFQPAAARQTVSFVVDSSLDDSSAHDKNPGDGNCLSTLDECTLRAAIEETNALGGENTITFASPMTIYLDSGEGTLTIEAATILNASGVWNDAEDRPGVNINGVDQSISCFTILADYAHIYGFYIYNCDTAITIYSSYSIIGDQPVGARNVISNNADYGIYIGNADAHHNLIQCNWIGLGIAGSDAVPNKIGIYIVAGAHDNIIGGYQSWQGNYISGNTNAGVYIAGSGSNGNLLGGNFIGPPAVGSQKIGNGEHGIMIASGAQSNRVGGDVLAGNTISMNGLRGISINNSHNNIVEANTIRQNGDDGIYILDGSGNTILSNTIAENVRKGITISGTSATGNVISKNSIYGNSLGGIDLRDGGNANRAAPDIFAADTAGAWGTACAFCTVEVFSDSSNQGQTYHGFTSADGDGNWNYYGDITGPKVTAITIDAGGNTSEFSLPCTFGPQIPVEIIYLPMMVKK